MSDSRLCPFRFQYQPLYQGCIGKRCVWWMDEDGACAMVAMAKRRKGGRPRKGTETDGET